MRTTKMELNLNFGGFYYSIHSDIVDSIVESNFDDNEFTEEFYESIDYQKTYLEYSKYYVKYFFDYLLDVEGIKLTIEKNNIDLWSPREYNFATDIIILKDVSNSAIKKLTTLFNRYLEDNEFRDFIKVKTTSRDGYIPFYNYEGIVAKKELDISLEFLLEFVANKSNYEVDDLYYINQSLNIFFISK